MENRTDRVRRHTAPQVLRRIDDIAVANLLRCADSPGSIDVHLRELDDEWDTDRVVEAEAASMGLLGLGLGVFWRRPLLALPAVVASAVLMYATTGRYPLMPLFRRLGVRTAKEIARERYALKVLRGDFAAVTPPRPDADTSDSHAARRLLPPTTRRVQLHTAPQINNTIRQRTDAELVRLDTAPAHEIERRLHALDREWDVERTLQTNASLIVLAGLTLAATVNCRILLLPAAVFTFFAQHALQGWCPPIPVFRRLGVRTQAEIERERYAVKALRGDFGDAVAGPDTDASERVRAVLAAVDR